jgi:KDEL-tailed cysteine endopeptidase
MKSARILLAMAWTRVVSAGDVPHYQQLWQDFQKQYRKAYTAVEEDHRFKIFVANVDKINAENAKGYSHELGITAFADMTSEEFNDMYIGGYNPALRSKSLQSTPFPDIKGSIPDAVDWVKTGAVTPVKNQKSCGSCWAFSTTGATEGAYYVASGKLVSLSEEQLVQCDHNSDSGCKGGLMDNAFEWIKEHGGICTEESYPYSSGNGETGSCTKGCSSAVVVTSHVDVPTEDEEALKKAVSQQPVSVAIEADKLVFQLYRGGVLNNATCGKKLDHGVLIVGYGTDGGKDYWKVKNSWGPAWGEEGYIRIARGENMCGIAQQASYPTGAKKAGPSPPAPPSPPSPPAPPSPEGAPHYEDPKDGCQSDEVAMRVQGVSGDICTPSCSQNACPTDMPNGFTAQPQCALSDAATQKKYCALICHPSSANQCGPNASCKKVTLGLGLCTYDDAAEVKAGYKALEVQMDTSESIIV